MKRSILEKLIYIASLGHSGSTILDLVLGGHSQIIGLGEISEIINADETLLLNKDFTGTSCSCGNDLCHCTFWSEVRQQFLEKNIHEKNTKNQVIMNIFSEKFGSNAIPVDSSKDSYEHIRDVHKSWEKKVYTIFLVRDFRNYSYSRNSVKGGNIIRWIYRWYKGNRKLEKYLKNIDANFITVGYEEFALYPELILKKICKFTGIDFQKDMLSPMNSKSHIMRGNIMRKDSRMKSGIFYDGRWLTSVKILALSPLLLPVMKWNNKHVYSNFITGEKKAYGKSQNDFFYFSNVRKQATKRLDTKRDL